MDGLEHFLSNMLNLEPTAKQVQATRTEREISIFEAKSIVQRDLLLNAVNSATTIEELKQILICLINNVRIK